MLYINEEQERMGAMAPQYPPRGIMDLNGNMCYGMIKNPSQMDTFCRRVEETNIFLNEKMW